MTLKPSFKFSLSFAGKIWQTALDSHKGIWALEVRDADGQRITYYLVYLAESKHQELGVIAEADWWTVILRLYYPVLVLEKYNDPQNPVDKDLILYHVDQRRVLGSLSQFQFEALQNNAILGCDPADQQVKKTFAFADKGITVKEDGEDYVRYPSYFPPGSESMKLVSQFIQTAAPGLGCEYYENENHIIISYYVRLDRKFDRKLLVLRGDDEIYHVVQDARLDGFASGAFFIFNNNFLVFIKNGNQINGIEL